MFARFRESPRRLQVNVVETRRISVARVRHEHVASLGSIELPLTVAGRMEFWRRLHERLARLSNRIDSTAQGKLLGAVHARIPMVMPDEQRALQIENAEADARLWGSLHDLHQGSVEGHKGLAATVERSIAEGQKNAAEACAKRAAAEDRLDRLRKGENLFAGLGKPMTREHFAEILRKAAGPPLICATWSSNTRSFRNSERPALRNTWRKCAAALAILNISSLAQSCGQS